MCGLIGYIKGAKSTSLNTKLADAFFQGLYVTALRGTDAFGYMFGIPGKFIKVGEYEPQTVDYYKQASHAVFNGGSKDSAAAKALIRNSTWAVGHCRAATQGAKDKDANAHPFQNGNITMVHNGTLRGSYYHLNDKYVEVDSNAISMALDTKPLNQVLDELNGAYALIWFDERDRSLHFVRNEERPLEFVTAQETGDIFFASEGWMAYGVMQRNGLSGKGLTMHTLPVNTHRSYNIDTKEWAADEVYTPVKKYPITQTYHIGSNGRQVIPMVGDSGTINNVAPFPKSATHRARFPQCLEQFIGEDSRAARPMFQYTSSINFLRMETEDQLTKIIMGINSETKEARQQAVNTSRSFAVLIAMNRFSALEAQSDYCKFEGEIISHSPGELRGMFPSHSRHSLVDWVGDVSGICHVNVLRSAQANKHLLVGTILRQNHTDPILQVSAGLTMLSVGLAYGSTICDEMHPDAENGVMYDYNELLNLMGDTTHGSSCL